jgi:hypothetical protein
MELVHLEQFDARVEALIRENQCEVNVIVSTDNLFWNDLEGFFGPLRDEDVFVFVNPGTTWAHVLAKLGPFKSISDARKNGWNKPIEEGFTDTFKVGKAHRKFITTFNPTDRLEKLAPGSGKSLKFELKMPIIKS